MENSSLRPYVLDAISNDTEPPQKRLRLDQQVNAGAAVPTQRHTNQTTIIDSRNSQQHDIGMDLHHKRMSLTVYIDICNTAGHRVHVGHYISQFSYDTNSPPSGLPQSILSIDCSERHAIANIPSFAERDQGRDKL